MFCSSEISHVLDCECHTLLASTIFTSSDLYKLYSIMRILLGHDDIFTAFLSQLRQVTIMPTHVYICHSHMVGSVRAKQTMFAECWCSDRCSMHYDGCVNEPDYIFPDYNEYYYDEYKLKYLLSSCYDFDGNQIECPGLATYFPEGTDSDDNSDVGDDNSDVGDTTTNTDVDIDIDIQLDIGINNWNDRPAW